MLRRSFVPVLALLLIIALTASPVDGAPPRGSDPEKVEAEESAFGSGTFAGLELRSIGPALLSGRVSDLAVDPSDVKVWWVATASSGLWKTVNAGTTWTPVFDGEGSYSIGALAIDPGNPNVVWVGTGENNSQRSVAYGDGVYRTLDGGKSWKRMGLDASEHIGMIRVDPRDSRTVWVAAQGPLWKSGGDRGLYRTQDGGETWQKALEISDDTGVSEVHLDPRHPDTVYAVAYQRRRHVWTLIDGGPESAIHKSTDGGKSWRKLTSGLPTGDLGRIGLAVSPLDPDIVYAIIEAEGDAGGVFRSTDRGESWKKGASYVSGSPQYYQELVPDPHRLDRLYSMDTFLKVSDDGGESWRNLGQKSMHVDHHAMWIDPRDRDHYVTGCDGGLYESFDGGASWRHFENLPIMQFYRLGISQTAPVYQVCGGTQDNNSLCGPTRTLSHQGPANEDWYVTQGGDGFWTAFDPTDENLVYAEYQYGGLARFDRRSGEGVDIQPQPAPGEEPYRWNWDSPLIVSPHSPTRLYFAANRLFRSDDRGDRWQAISPDLTRRIDRNQLEVFGTIQRPEAVARAASTSFYGTIVALDESPLVEGLLYAGTDDGLIQISEDAGATWRRVDRVAGVPERAYVSRLVASCHEPDVVYAAFDDHKMGDFRPFVQRSADRGRTWRSIAGDLPERGTVYALVEDHVDSGLLFAGTEFGLYFTADGGDRWLRLKGGLPTIQVRDLAIQRRTDDLVVATFGRGFYVLDDFSSLRGIDAERLEAPAILFPPRTAELYVPSSRIGSRGKGSLGETFYVGDNPPFGAVFTFYVKEPWEPAKSRRQKAEKEATKADGSITYPTLEALRAESRQEDSKLVLTVADSDGTVVRRLETADKKGVQRIAWDLRHPAADPASKGAGDRSPWAPPKAGPWVVPGTYTVRLQRVADGEVEELAGPASFAVEALGRATLPAADRAAVAAFQTRVARLQRAVLGAESLLGELAERLELVRKAISDTPALALEVDAEARALELRLEEIEIALAGDRFLSGQREPTPPSISDRVMRVVYSSWYASSEPTGTERDAYRHAGALFAAELERLRELADEALPALERKLEAAGAPWTPGRVPEWRPEP